jgi:kynureninase
MEFTPSEMTAIRGQFPEFAFRIHLNPCNLPPTSNLVSQAIDRYGEQRRQLAGSIWFVQDDGWFAVLDKLRRQFAQLIGAFPEEVGLVPSVSAGLSSIASSLQYATRNKVVTTDMEFPTVPPQWLVRQERDLPVECTVLRSPDRVSVPLEAFKQAIDESTALVVTSRVYFRSGAVQDVRALADIAHQQGAWLVIDDYQALGQLTLGVHESGIDFLVTGAMKWLLGESGIAFVYMRKELQHLVMPLNVGWFGNTFQFELDPERFAYRESATRMEQGTPAMLPAYATSAALEWLLELGPQRIAARTKELAELLIELIARQGWTLRASGRPEERSAIVCLDLGLPESRVSSLVKETNRQGIMIDSRKGIIRIAPYFYNTEEEIEQVIRAISQALEPQYA